MTATAAPVTSLDHALAALDHAVGLFQAASLDGLSPAEELAAVGRLEVLRRRLDHGTDRAAGHLDRSAAFALDGHRTAKSALKAIGRLTGSEAHGRVQTARALRWLPLVDAAYAAAMARLGTPKLTRALIAAIERQAPPRAGLIRPKLRYAHQGGVNPPRIIIHGNALDRVPESYKRYLEGFFRDKFSLAGTPMRIEFRTGRNPYANKKR